MMRLRLAVLIVVALQCTSAEQGAGSADNHPLHGYTWDEVKSHSNEDSCWVVIDNFVINVTQEWLNKHPGGKKPFLKRAGRDATEAYHRIGHSAVADAKLRSLTIGILLSPTPDANSVDMGGGISPSVASPPSHGQRGADEAAHGGTPTRLRLTRPLSAGVKADRHHLHVRELSVLQCDGQSVGLTYVDGSRLMRNAKSWETPLSAIDGDMSTYTHDDYETAYGVEDLWMEFECDVPYEMICKVQVYLFPYIGERGHAFVNAQRIAGSVLSFRDQHGASLRTHVIATEHVMRVSVLQPVEWNLYDENGVDEFEVDGKRGVLSMDDVRTHADAEGCWIVINRTVVDVTGFLTQHPGGAGRLNENCGSDATAAFELIGHSTQARQVVRHYAVGTLGSEITQPRQRLGSSQHGSQLLMMLSRLNSGHDLKHVHKILGALVLGNFGYRVWSVAAAGFGPRGFTMSQPTVLNVASLMAHMALPVASMQFSVPKLKKGYYIIFQSYRLEVIWFTLKYSSAVLLRWCFPGGPGSNFWLKVAHVMATHMVVDVSNALTRDPENGTPVRGTHEEIWAAWDRETLFRVIDRAFNHFGAMIAQVSAVMTSLDAVDAFHPHVIAETMFMSLLPIQGHAFSMTLIRKNIISDGYFKKALYALMLLPGVALGIRNGGRVLGTCVAIYIALRIWLPKSVFGLDTKYGYYLLCALVAREMRRRQASAKNKNRD